MSICARFLPALLLASILPHPALARAESPSQADLLARLNAARDATDLTDPTLKPWHLVASFDLLDPKGAVTQHGTFEEWWAAPDKWHQHVASPSFNWDSFRVGEQSFTAPAAHRPYFVTLLIEQVLHPIPKTATDATHSITQQTQSFGQVQLDCLVVQLAKQPVGAAFGIAQTFCLEQQQPRLRFSMDYGLQEISRNRAATFHGKFVALDLSIQMAQRPVLRAKIDQLQSVATDDANFVPPADMPATPIVPHIGAGVVAGSRIGGVPLVYPDIAKLQRVSGTVLLRAVISKDGRIHSTDVIWAPDPNLATAATDSVKTWTYHPFLLNGEPTEVETMITVNFNLGH